MNDPKYPIGTLVKVGPATLYSYAVGKLFVIVNYEYNVSRKDNGDPFNWYLYTAVLFNCVSDSTLHDSWYFTEENLECYEFQDASLYNVSKELLSEILL